MASDRWSHVVAAPIFATRPPLSRQTSRRTRHHPAMAAEAAPSFLRCREEPGSRSQLRLMIAGGTWSVRYSRFDGGSCKPGRSQKLPQRMSFPGLGGKAEHRRGHEIRQPVRIGRMSFGDIAADHCLGGEMTGARRVPRVAIVTVRAFHDEASRGGRIGGVKAGSFLQNGSKTQSHGPVTAKQAGERKRMSGAVAVQHTVIERGLASERGIEAGRINAERLRDVRDTDTVISMRMEKALRDRHRVVRVEATWATSGSMRFCSQSYTYP